MAPAGERALQRFVDSIRGLHLAGEAASSAAADTLAPAPSRQAGGWPDSAGRVRHIDEVGWHQLEPVVMDD